MPFEDSLTLIPVSETIVTPKFTNKQNEQVVTKDGRKIWLSRSCAVVMHVVIIDVAYDTMRCLVVKRGRACPDFAGSHCLPCGYLDMNETSGQAALRETWEETGLDLVERVVGNPNVEVLYDDTGDDEVNNPWFVYTQPTTEKQNVTMHHGMIAVLHEGDMPSLDPRDAVRSGEVDGAFWMPTDRFLAEGLDVCFNHKLRHERFVEIFRERVAPYRRNDP